MKYPLSILFLLTISSKSLAVEVDGQFDCKIISSQITSVSEGKSYTFNFWKDSSLNINDIVSVTFQYPMSDYELVGVEVRHPKEILFGAVYDAVATSENEYFRLLNSNKVDSLKISDI